MGAGHWKLVLRLLLIQVNLLVLMPGDGGAYLRGRFAELGLLVGEEPLLGAG
jgi:hypothetical protein